MDRFADDLRRFLAEDLGTRDVTSEAVVPASLRARGRVVARAPLVVAGLVEASRVFAELGVKVEQRAREGEPAGRGEVLLALAGPARAILAGERLALNFLTRMSGIATATRAMVDAARAVNPRCRVAATRKTTPGFRAYEKRAVVVGGGDPHREGLFDAFLVKDNHLALAPDIAAAVARCRALDPKLPVEVEADTSEEARAAAAAGADWVLLDNRTPEAFADEARKLREAFPRVRIEASGRITPATLPRYAEHADRVSMGYLTASAPAADVSLEVDVGPPD